MKLSVSTWSFHTLIEAGDISVVDCVQKAKEIGFEGIEFVEMDPADGETLEDLAKRVREECERVGMAVVSYTVGADLLNGSRGTDADGEVERLKKEVDIAAILGAPLMRHDATRGFRGETREWQGFDSVLPVLADKCRAVTEYAAEKGIRTMVENHGFFAQDSERLEKLVNAVAHKNFGLIVDIGNFLCVDENPAAAVSRLAPYAFLAHAKDFHVKSGMEPNPGEGFFISRGGNYLRGAIIGHGNVPVLQCLRILKRAGYEGYLSMEFEGIEEAVLGMRVGFENLKHYLTMI